MIYNFQCHSQKHKKGMWSFCIIIHLYNFFKKSNESKAKKKKVFQEKKERKPGTAVACIFAIAVSRHWRVKADTCKLDKLSLSPTLLLKPQITQTSYPFLFYFLSLKIKKKRERIYFRHSWGVAVFGSGGQRVLLKNKTNKEKTLLLS